MYHPVCPYTAPHVHAVDFPALMVRQRARALRDGRIGAAERALGETDRNGRLLGAIAPLANWAGGRSNRCGRALMEGLAGIHRDAVLPRFHGRRFSRRAAAALVPWIERGWEVIAPIPSCALMMKTTWPRYLPDDEAVARLVRHTSDISEYIVGIARGKGLAEGLAPLDGDVALHQACHARAQNIGAKAAVMLRMIPQCNVMMMQRCAGHGGTWGVMKDNFEIGMKVGEPVMRQAAESGRAYLASECPLAGDHIVQGMERFGAEPAHPTRVHHPIELMAKSYGIDA